VQLGDRDVASDLDAGAAADRRADLDRAMGRLRPRERALLWLAYGVGQPHTEIADALGVKTGSVKPLLFRARRKLAGLLRGLQPLPSRGHDRDVR
jgi:RNA polymerase sigma-70 factor (ECF subfamily)